MTTFFAGKRYLVVGGSGVLGAETARQLTSHGAAVALIVRTPSNIPHDLAPLAHAIGDVRTRDSLAHALGALGGTFDGIINAAGRVAFGAVGDVPEAVVAELFHTNAIGTLNVIALGASVTNEGGVIASLTGVAADMTIIGMSAYCASKAAAHRAMVIAARELRSRKITVLDIRAPHTETGLVGRALHGTAPKMPPGLAPEAVVRRILTAVADGEKDLPAEAFATC